MTARDAAVRIINELRAAGFNALLAGGCVRDMLMERPAQDYDVATDATPEQISRIFRRTLRIGAQFGVVVVLLADQQVEVATFRTDSDYADGRHPSAVTFSTPSQDALRRDFTINGMFYDPVSDKVIDYVGGTEDLRKKTIRTIGQPQQRFSEDYLRMLRAVRFSTELGFAIAPQTWSAIVEYAPKIAAVSGERINAELQKMLTSPNRAAGAEILFLSGMAGVIFPDYSDKNAQKAIKVMAHLPAKANFCLALAAFFADCDTDFARQRLKILKFSRNQTRHINFLLSHRGVLKNTHMPLADLRLLGSEEHFDDLLALETAIIKARHPHDRAALEPLGQIKQRLEQAEKPLRPEPLISGDDLIAMGIKPGPAMGKLLEQIYRMQLEGRIADKEQAEVFVRQSFPDQES